MMIQRIQDLSRSLLEEVRAYRRYLHQNPELSGEEEKTAQYVAGILKDIGIPFQNNLGGHGIVAIIQGEKKGDACFALRADMDALPIQEIEGRVYGSQKPSVMHACGHDVHTASLLGAAKILWQLRSEFGGTIKLIFQPSEEKMPSGAEAMIRDGVLQNPLVNGIAGQHVTPELDRGKVGFCSGPFMASADEIYLSVIGKGGHAAAPHKCIDPVLISAHILVALQQIISRKRDPLMPAVLSFGDIHGYGATNIIPDKVEIKGTLRAYDENWRQQALKDIEKIATETARMMGGDCVVHIPEGCPYVMNDPSLTQRLRALAVDYMGEENVLDMKMRMGAEDFSFYSHQLPACFYRLGTGNDQYPDSRNNIHTPAFDIDEEALITGVGLMAWLAIAELQNQS